LAQPIERDANFGPCLIERHHVLVRIDDLLDVLVVVVPLDQVMLLSFNIFDLLFEPKAIKMGLIYI
jgi:hypothetical protein